MKAYKVFNSDWTCKGFKFEVGKEYFQDGKIELCKNGFHACIKVSDCFNYYSFDPSNKVAEVELSGEILGLEEDKQYCSNIKIVREIEWSEVLILANSGDRNSGHSNSGKWNSGHSNSGNWNSGKWNSGHSNSGHSNSGDWNSGKWNSGNWNSGNWNSGNWNSGHSNSGDWNSGNWNSGNWNSGDWNSGDWNSGLFNTDSPKLRLFNKSTDLNFYEVNIPSVFYFDLTQWVSFDTATEQEKEEYKTEIETCGGFLKTIEYKEAFKRAWSNASEEDRKTIKDLPNFDAELFYEISGIKV